MWCFQRLPHGMVISGGFVREGVATTAATNLRLRLNAGRKNTGPECLVLHLNNNNNNNNTVQLCV